MLSGIIPDVAAAAGVPPSLKIKIVLAAVAFDRSIDKRFGDSVEVAVIGKYQKSALEKVLLAAGKKKIKGKKIRLVKSAIETLTKDDVDVVIFADSLGSQAGSVASACQTAQLTCVAANEDDVKAGLPIGVEVAGGKPKLLINMAAAKACGAKFSAQILKLARLVK